MTVVEIGVGIGVAGVTGGVGILIIVASAVVPLVLHSYSHHPPTIAYQTGGGWGEALETGDGIFTGINCSHKYVSFPLASKSHES